MYKVINFHTDDEDILSERIETMCPDGYKFVSFTYKGTLNYSGYVGVYIKTNVI